MNDWEDVAWAPRLNDLAAEEKEFRIGDLVEHVGRGCSALDGGPGEVVSVNQDNVWVRILVSCNPCNNAVAAGEILFFSPKSLRVVQKAASTVVRALLPDSVADLAAQARATAAAARYLADQFKDHACSKPNFGKCIACLSEENRLRCADLLDASADHLDRLPRSLKTAADGAA